jgi:hypothetical protein
MTGTAVGKVGGRVVIPAATRSDRRHTGSETRRPQHHGLVAVTSSPSPGWR